MAFTPVQTLHLEYGGGINTRSRHQKHWWRRRVDGKHEADGLGCKASEARYNECLKKNALWKMSKKKVKNTRRWEQTTKAGLNLTLKKKGKNLKAACLCT